MSKISYITQNIRKGDISLVATIVGCDEGTVKRMLLEDEHPLKRSHKTELGKKVIAALEEVINHRFLLKKKYHRNTVAA